MKLKILALFTTLTIVFILNTELWAQPKFICMDTVMQSNIMMQEFPENYSSETDEISATDYKKHKKKKNKNDKIGNISSVLLTDSSITIYLAKGEKEFRSTNSETYEYVRQLSSLKLHLITHSSASSATASLLLVDGITGYVTYTFSPFDTCIEDLIISPDSKKLCGIVNDVYEDNKSALMTIGINYHDKGYTLEPEIILNFDTYNIDEFCWAGNNSIALKTIRVSMEDAGTEEQQSSVHYLRITWTK